MKHFLNGKTIVCEYCGNNEYQHLIKYSSIDLHFYAIVDNNSEETCLPVDFSYDFFNKYGLTSCIMKKYTSNTLSEFNEIIHNLYVEVAQSSLDNDGEGSVLYFVKENIDNGEQKCVSLAKLKTLEYRLYRKLREKQIIFTSSINDFKTSLSAELILIKGKLRYFGGSSNFLFVTLSNSTQINQLYNNVDFGAGDI
ncbi:hypothetical protein IMG5_001080 [Ichthyophthirius multifiliis]|uniref:Uncharacterized protein n=1 Tax=Ichthyophthirius multifiliis TaxID=5932 RepID=G0QIP9_ICHMU|nr:hypothetical protein IMG5_001080 [Ichthyophthirius multifiliis]EGR34881.1 hypothetical protein IMG5_001080 [Ichthyophthirius multifiliis]|eukprot:XP_004040185.1 hypothetical protein IMG5_001080 [Ichthyophthirius multifiliis]